MALIVGNCSLALGELPLIV